MGGIATNSMTQALCGGIRTKFEAEPNLSTRASRQQRLLRASAPPSPTETRPRWRDDRDEACKGAVEKAVAHNALLIIHRTVASPWSGHHAAAPCSSRW